MMTPNATKTIVSLSGKGAPLSRACGTARATARETAPRKPHRPETMRERSLTRRSRCCGRRSMARMR